MAPRAAGQRTHASRPRNPPSINPWLYRNAGLDPVRDFEPVMSVATAPCLLVANPKFPANDLKGLIEYAMNRPGRIDYASAGNRTLNHLLGVMFNQRAGLHLVHIPYRGAAAAAADVAPSTPAELARLTRDDLELWSKIVKRSGTTLD